MTRSRTSSILRASLWLVVGRPLLHLYLFFLGGGGGGGSEFLRGLVSFGGGGSEFLGGGGSESLGWGRSESLGGGGSECVGEEGLELASIVRSSMNCSI